MVSILEYPLPKDPPCILFRVHKPVLNMNQQPRNFHIPLLRFKPLYHPEKVSKIKILGTCGKMLFNENSTLLGLQMACCFVAFNFAQTAMEPQLLQEAQQSQKISSFQISTFVFLWDQPRYTSSSRFLKGIKCNIINFVKMISTRDMQDKHKNGWKIKSKLLGLKLKFSGVIK